MRILDFLVIIALVLFWYALIPAAGAIYTRTKWRKFRERFDLLRLKPLLNYAAYCGLSVPAGEFRFTGGFESITDQYTLWIKGENLTIPVSLANAQIWLLPMQEGEGIPEAFDPGEEAPERIRWDRIATLTEGAKVFVGGEIRFQDKRWSFVSTQGSPLLILFYDCPDHSLTPRTIRSSRHRNEYWNAVTPYSLIMGAICLLLFASLFLNRPAFRLTVITALAALFVPAFPLIPPGLLFTVVYRRLAWNARILRAYHDLARLPLRYLGDDQESAALPNGEIYGFITYKTLPEMVKEGKIPILIPEYSAESGGKNWHIFGALRPGYGLPAESLDPFATFGVLPEKPGKLASRYVITAYILEAAAWLALLSGIGLNVFFIRMILVML